MGPSGPAFYEAPLTALDGPHGSLIWQRSATGLAALSAAARTDLVLYRSQRSDGLPTAVSGTVSVPKGDPPSGGWPLVSWSHVTTGGADSCAPSRVTEASPELEMMTRSDELANDLLKAGVAVARTDDEGLGTPGAHPYLIGRSLARSQIDIVAAARELEPSIGERWAAAGHSEGGVGSLFSGAISRNYAAPGLQLRAVEAFAPPTRMGLEIEAVRRLPIPGGGLNALAALIISGLYVSDPTLASQMRAGALGPLALAHLPDIEDRCFTALGDDASWGGIPLNQLAGPRFAASAGRFYADLDENDPAHLNLGNTPVRIDQGLLDTAVLFPFQNSLVAEQRLRGANLDYNIYPLATHPSIVSRAQAGGDATAWLIRKLRQ